MSQSFQKDVNYAQNLFDYNKLNWFSSFSFLSAKINKPKKSGFWTKNSAWGLFNMLNIIGFVILIVVSIFAYKTAKDYERNAIAWALITFAVGFVLQIIVPILIVIVMVIVMMVRGSTPEQLQQDIPDVMISIIFLVISIAACVFIVGRLARIPEEKPFEPPPAPPTDFNLNS